MPEESVSFGFAVGEGTRAPASRPARIAAVLRELLTELSGEDYNGADGAAPFASMGFDSLLLMQLTLAIEKKFGVQLVLRDLLDRFPTLDAVAARIDAEVPSGTAWPMAASAGPEAPGPVSVSGTVNVNVNGNEHGLGNGTAENAGAPPAWRRSAGEPGRALEESRAKALPAAMDPAGTTAELTGDGVEWPWEAASKTAMVVSLPLTPTQRELWFAAQVSDAASCVYNECRFLRLDGSLERDALQSALRRLVERHESLRTTFTIAGDWQRVHPVVHVPLALEDWSRMDPGERSSRLDAVRREEAAQPFNLVEGPLVRARLIRGGDLEHLLVMTVHHLICDGYSLGILLGELGRLYAAVLSGSDAGLPPVLQFSEYARAQTRRRDPAEQAADGKFWLEQYRDGAPTLELPTDLPRPASWKFDGARQSCVIPETLVRSLGSVSAESQCTLFSTLLAGFVLLLRRLSGQEQVVVGIPAAARAMEGGQTVVGHCVKFLAVRHEICDEQTGREHVARVQSTFLDAYVHHGHTFGALLQQLNLPRDPSRPPLVGVTFNYERIGVHPEFPPAVTSLSLNPDAPTNFELSFNVTEHNGTLEADCRYSTSLFLPETIQRWLGHYVALLESLAQSPRKPISSLSILSEAERRRMLVEWNRTEADYPRNACVHQLVEEQVRRTPEAVALEFEEETLTYRALDDQATRLAGRLQEQGLEPEFLAGIFMERSPRMVIAVLAVLKAGGAYLPLDPAHPRERLDRILQDTRASVLLTEDHLFDAIPASGVPRLSVNRIIEDGQRGGEGGAPAPREAGQRPPVTPEHLAYVIPTSGSTGTPKCVAVEHRSAVNCIHYLRNVYSPAELSNVLFSTSLCFDISVAELFVPLSTGGRVILAQDIFQLPQLPSRSRVTLLQTVPSAAAELVRLGAVPDSVRVVNLAGESLPAALVDRVYRIPGVEKVYDLYGPSETTVYSTRALRRPGGPATIGRPIANTRIYLLDPHRNPVPIGVRGEMFIGGDGLARGYLHQPELTEASFIPDPFAGQPGARMYRTGDVARWMPDGTIEFLGRADYQVKIRGYRVELGEVEAVLSQHPAVRTCVVVAPEESPGTRRLVGYVVQAPEGAPANVSGLRRFLRQRLPEYMVPATFIFLDELPVTASGKIDRRSLPAPEETRVDLDTAFALPSTPTEEALARIWREVLGVERVGAHDNFFELGGHSLLVAQVISRVRQAFQVDLPFRSLFESPTIAGVARAIEELVFKEIAHPGRQRAGHVATVQP